MSTRQAQAWLVLATVLLYGSLGALPELSDALRTRGLLGGTVGLLGVAAVAAVVVGLRGRLEGEPPVLWVPAALALLGAIGWGLSLPLPEEALHLVLYPPLGLLAWRAAGRRWPVALLCIVAIGLGDEVIQAVLPQRTFDLRDLSLNGVAGGASVLIAAGGRRSWLAPVLLAASWWMTPPPDAPAEPAAGPLPLHPPTAQRPTEVPAPSSPSRYAGSSVLLITVDALRADKVPPWGTAQVPTEAFVRLQRQSISPQEAFANALWTSPSIVSLLTGLNPATHGVGGRGLDFAPGATTPLEVLAAAGYRVWGFAGASDETYRNLGIRHSLDRDLGPLGMLEQVLDEAEDGPFFAWLHLRTIHAPYDSDPATLEALGLRSDLPNSPILDRARSHYTVPRRDFPGRHGWLREPIDALYQAELAQADTILGTLLDRVAASPLQDRILVVVTADHGEELLDHEGIGHASTTLDSSAQDELIRIPFYLRLPDGAGAGRIVPGRFAQTDFMPTLFGLLGFELPEFVDGVEVDGSNLAPQLLAADLPEFLDRKVLVSSSPCGWQCPPERRGERVHALVLSDDVLHCREPGAPCDPALDAVLREARARARLLKTPVTAAVGTEASSAKGVAEGASR